MISESRIWAELQEEAHLFISSKAHERFVKGIFFSLQSCIRAITDIHIRSVYTSRVKHVCYFAVGTAIFTKVLLLPFRLLFSLISLIFQLNWQTSWLDVALGKSIGAIIYSCILIFKYVNSSFFESIFFAGLKTQDPKAARDLHSMHYAWFRPTLVRFGKYCISALGMGFVYMLFPILFPFLLPFMSVVRFGIKIRKINWLVFGVSILCFMNPSTRTFAVLIVQWWLDARCLLRELLDPFYGRVSHASFSKFYTQHEAFMLGFYLPFAVIPMYLPYVLQPLVWIIGYAAAGILANELR